MTPDELKTLAYIFLFLATCGILEVVGAFVLARRRR